MNIFGSHLKKKLQDLNHGKGSGGGGKKEVPSAGLEKMLGDLSTKIETMVQEQAKKIDKLQEAHCEKID
eukprot:CAMPEP_0170496946 /NCGR_PEP_ID=MMETSP0208-20121228/23209_1 /TAXON_ID=197538 /ORGANISM="Strombidium inclinatum, Strain S3" /LENGTH=68 /DNA_ID=CAMNT_0010773611 /DNA_START=1356 /DNA_END=1562 /DNA_ORIENTATION=+